MMRITTLTLLLLWAVTTAFSQDFASSFIQKHGDKDLEIVSIGKQMLSMVGEMSAQEGDLKEALEGLESIKILSSDAKDTAQKSFKNAYAMLTKKSNGFSEMMSFKEDDESTFIMAREEEGIVKDLVLLSSEGDSFNMICLSGNINVKTLGKLSSSMQIDKLSKLNKTQEK